MNVLSRSLSPSLSTPPSAHHRRYLERRLVGDGRSLVSCSFFFLAAAARANQTFEPLNGLRNLDIWSHLSRRLQSKWIMSRRGSAHFSRLLLSLSSYSPGRYCSNFWSASPSPTSWRPVSPASCTLHSAVVLLPETNGVFQKGFLRRLVEKKQQKKNIGSIFPALSSCCEDGQLAFRRFDLYRRAVVHRRARRHWDALVERKINSSSRCDVR